MRRRERLFAITEYLRGRRNGVTAEALAERFGVTVRTIYRDLDSLRDAELPVRADRGRGGGYALDRAYTLPPINFTAREAALLVKLGQFATDTRLLPFADTLAGALDKVRGALSTSAQRDLIELMEAIHFLGVPAHAVSTAVRRPVEQAWFERQPLRIRYQSGDYVVSTRVVRIVSVILERGVTLLNCDDLDKGEQRQFRLDRIISAESV
ncbi:MAG TPA: HTH domain-containing protein [Polyangia bacterium]|jgi:predicted DNA-binding transcriptional regulator YafY|nr:HTH domain-containing protein [Polyangia bacterium]